MFDLVSDELRKEWAAVVRKNPTMKAEVKDRKSHAEKQKYAKEWFGLRAKEVREHITALEELIIEDTQIGRMMGLGRIAWEINPADPDIEAATNWAKSCIQIGRSQFKINVGGRLSR